MMATTKPRTDELQSLRARIAHLEGVIVPFAEHGARLRLGDRRGTARKQVYDLGVHVLTLGHFDAARAALVREVVDAD